MIDCCCSEGFKKGVINVGSQQTIQKSSLWERMIRSYTNYIFYFAFSPSKDILFRPKRTWVHTASFPPLACAHSRCFHSDVFTRSSVTFLSLSFYLSDELSPLSHLDGVSCVTFLVNGSVTESVLLEVSQLESKFSPSELFLRGGSAEAQWCCVSSPQ